MAFWGIRLVPGKSFIHRFDIAKGRLHITQATLDDDFGAFEVSAVRCIVGDKDPILLCALRPSKEMSCPLNLDFGEEDDVVFSVIGRRSVYLTGFYIKDCFCRNFVIETNKAEARENRPKDEAKEGGNHGSKGRSHNIVQDVGLKKVPEPPEDSSSPATEIGDNINNQPVQDGFSKVSSKGKENDSYVWSYLHSFCYGDPSSKVN